MKSYKQLGLPSDSKSGWQKEWEGMPEYDNVDLSEPEIVVTFKFRNKDDFDIFHEVIKKELYNGERVFDGTQRKKIKSAWFPLKQKASCYVYQEAKSEP